MSTLTTNILSSSLGAGVYLGQVVPYTVEFQIKNIGNNQDVYLQPSENIEFNSACYRLIGTDITSVIAADLTGIITSDDNAIYFENVSSGGSKNYITLVYYFLVTCASWSTWADEYSYRRAVQAVLVNVE